MKHELKFHPLTRFTALHVRGVLESMDEKKSDPNMAAACQ
jgi:hypothetical protein